MQLKTVNHLQLQKVSNDVVRTKIGFVSQCQILQQTTKTRHKHTKSWEELTCCIALVEER